MNIRKNQAGFSAVEVVIVLVVIAMLGFIGYTVLDRQKSDDAKNQATTQQAEATDVSPAPQIKSSDDLDKAAKMLDENDPALSNNDASQLDSELSNF